MTTYQDPPLQSRRAARQGERAAAYGQQPEQAPEPLTYATQNRPPVPQYGGPDFRARRTPETANGEPAPEQAASEQPDHRSHDVSHQGRRAVRAEGPAEPAAPPVAEAPAREASAPAEHAPIEHTMTRRELRALREAQGLSMAAPAPAAPAAVSPVAVPAAAEAAIAEAPVAPAAPVASEPFALIEPKAPVTSATPVAPELSPFEALFAPPSAPASEPAVQDITPDPIVEEQAASVEEPAAEPVAVVEEPIAEAPVVQAPVVQAPVVVAPAPVAPAGHWSTQAELDDATQVNESTISRSVGAGSGVITTSALVLPSLPNPEFGNLGTGEILVTGSIDLPHSLATSGAHPTQLDEHHLDHELDPGDHQVVSTDSQPVRAIKAISSHTSTRDVIVAKKRTGNRVLTALIVTAAGMAAVVVTLLVVGLVSGVL